MNASINHMAIADSTGRVHSFPTKQRLHLRLSCRPFFTFFLGCVSLPICVLLAVALATIAVMLPASLVIGWL